MQSSTSPFKIARCVFRRLALPSVAAAALLCGTLAGERSASAQVVSVAPPAPRVEIVPPAPAVSVWAPGYWGWRPSVGYAWYGGRWIARRPGYAWRSPHWASYGGRWHFAPGRWHRR